MATVVSFARCKEYEQSAVDAAVTRAMAAIGGISAFVKPGATVLLKPNMLSDREPENAITTHPAVVRAVIRLVKACGGTPVVADSSASVIKLEKVWERTGFAALCREEHVPLLNLEKAGSRQFAFGDVSYSVAAPVLDADVVINLPKLKTHVLTILTNAVKNIYGTMPGYQKAMWHKRLPRPKDLAPFLAELYAQVKPELTLCDAIVGMHGDGPSAGEPVALGFVAASADGAALDACVCRLLKINPRHVLYLDEIRKRNAGVIDVAAIQLAGDAIEPASVPKFRLPSTLIGRAVPGWLVHLLAPYVWIKPFFTDRCIRCGLCVKSCPVVALTMPPGEKPVLNRSVCIECCCCHEVCPVKAIEMSMSPLLRLRARGQLS